MRLISPVSKLKSINAHSSILREISLGRLNNLYFYYWHCSELRQAFALSILCVCFFSNYPLGSKCKLFSITSGTFLVSKRAIYQYFLYDLPQVKIKVVSLMDHIFTSTMTFIGRTSMLAFIFLTTSYFVTGQIIPGVAWTQINNTPNYSNFKPKLKHVSQEKRRKK